MATAKVIDEEKLIIEKLEVFNDDKLLLVSLNKSFESNLNDDELYEITRGNWFRVKEEIAKNTDYILGIYKKKVCSVIKKEEYEFIGDRCRFTGELIKNSLYLGKTTDDYKMQQIGWLYEPDAIKQKSTFIENVDVENVVDLNQYTEVIEKYDKTKFLEEVFIEENDFETIKALLERKKNIILQGAPGVGKTFAAKKIAYSMIGKEDEDLIKIVQFHQNYSYEDFVEGYKPNKNGSFELKNGVFKEFCKGAEQDDKNKYFFIIDEINRGNLSKIFGELLMLIEDTHRGEKINLAYSGEEFCVPENVYIIGMMNTADRSLAMIDYALRRRFSFFEMQPAFENEKFIKMIKGKNLENVVEKIKSLNEEICKDASLGKGFCIGHSYFCNLTDDNKETLQNIIDYEIAPMLKEYWFDDINKYNKEIELLNKSLNDNSQKHSN